MNTASVLQPVLENGIEFVKFFNGRLLTAEDFDREHQAQGAVQRLLGQASGAGVARGLRVSLARSTTEPLLSVEAGLAINALGEPVLLPRDIVLDLRPGSLNTATPVVAGASAEFDVCDVKSTGLYVAGRDLWLLTAFPAQGTRGRAPVTGLGNSTSACNAKYVVHGVQFRLIPLTAELPTSAFAQVNEPKLRSLLASRCFDVPQALASAEDGVTTPVRGRLLDSLRQRKLLSAAEVPLAVFYWRAESGFAFIDRWAVRRPLAFQGQYPGLREAFSERQQAESEAMLNQFQEQLDDLIKVDPETLRARDHFVYLPPLGVLPIRGNPRRRGVSLPRFFEGFCLRDSLSKVSDAQPGLEAYTVIEGSRVSGLLREALGYPPLDAGSDELVWIYQVRENLEATLAPGSALQPYALFVRGAVPFRGEANYDVSHWGFATYE